MTVDEIVTAIKELYGDTSVPPETTLEQMQQIADVVDANITALEDSEEGHA